MGINRQKVLDAQYDIAEKILQITNTLSQPIRKAKATEILKSVEKCKKAFEGNHEKIMADGIGEENYFINKTYEKTIDDCNEIIAKIMLADDSEASTSKQGQLPNNNNIQTPSANVFEAANQQYQLQTDNNKQILLADETEAASQQRKLQNDNNETGRFKKKSAKIMQLINELWSQEELNIVEIKHVEDEWSELQNLYRIKWQLEYNSEIELIYEDTKQQVFEFRRNKTNPKPLNEITQQQTNLELEKLKIPMFFGEVKEWATFQSLFLDMVHNNKSISNSEKMLRLRLNVRGEAAKLIQHLHITSANYNAAWNLLQQRYENKRLLFTTHWDRLLDQKSINSNNAESVRELLDTTNECINAIKGLNIPIDENDPFIARIIIRKLDKESLRLYEQSIKTKEVQTLKSVMDFLDFQFQMLTAVTERENSSKPYKPPTKLTQTTTTNKQENRDVCLYCGERHHTITNCRKFKASQIGERQTFIRNRKLCTRCLQHENGKFCQNWHKKCHECGKSHHELLHTSQNNNATTMTTNSTSTVILATTLIKAQAYNGEHLMLRALIDQGSQITTISEEAAQLLNLPRTRSKTLLHGLGNAIVGESKYKLNVTIKPRFMSNYQEDVDAIILPTLTSAQPIQSFQYDNKVWEQYLLADPMFNKTDRIDMVMGGDVFGKIIEEGVLKINGLLGQATKLGWILSGIITQPMNHITSAVTNLEKFWEMEEVQDDQTDQIEQDACMLLYNQTTKRDQDGRFIVKVPFMEKVELGDSRNKAVARLISLERNFKKNLRLEGKYKAFMDEYISLGHMTKLKDHAEKKYYIPHQAVIREDSSTTKLRVVFDASSKTSNGVSLNDVMYSGPKLQKDIFDIIIKWRLWRYGLTADIEKMYRQIKIAEQDRKYHCILWRNDSSSPIEEYHLNTVTYGTTAAPFLAIRTLMETSKFCTKKQKWLQEVIKNDFYMDDLMTGADTFKRCKEIQKQIDSHLAQFGFHLRKWMSNCILITQGIETSKEHEVVEIKEDKTIKTLGLHWDPKKDEFMFKINFDRSKKNTKRNVLSQIAQIFDPLGWLSPITINAKLYMQKLWVLKITWDEKLNDTLDHEWKEFLKNIEDITEIRIPRWINTYESQNMIIHGFGDASEKAYAAVVFVKINESVKMLTAKTKVNPLKNRKTLPKLELCAAYLLSKLIKKINETIKRKSKIFAWSDSTIALGWINKNKTKDKFIRNKVIGIKSLIPDAKWLYVPTKENPADVASRGTTPIKLKENKLWWNGPDWLLKPENEWPSQCHEPTKNVSILVVTQQQIEFIDELINRYSSWQMLIRVLAYILRFTKSKSKTKNKFLAVQELKTAATIIIKLQQSKEFKEELKAIKKDEHLTNNSKILNLNPFLDSENILRVGGRLRNAEIAYETKHPIILKKSKLTYLLIKEAHHATIHGGNRLVEAIIRRNYWILGLKNAIKQYIRSCPKCIRYRQQPANQLMGNLPQERVSMSSPFTATGVDYAGPFQIRCSKTRGQRTFKGYVALFVCLSTKAVHLEAVSDLSTEAFLAALRRFFARRGKPSHVYSDNATNFVGAHRWLDKEFKKAIQQNSEVAPILANEYITWHFIPPAGPHFGGIWEAGVKAMKYHLKRAVGETKLTFEEITTVLTQIEASLNSRPLYALNEENGCDALTPGHFLIGKPLLSIPTCDVDFTESTLNKWKIVQKIQRDFWKRWKEEYLHTLQQRNKWKISMENLEKGDVVIIKNEDTPPAKWPLARILETHPGSDGRVRVVTLKLQDTVLKRPVHKICPLTKDSNSKELEKTRRNGLSTMKAAQKSATIFLLLISLCYATSAPLDKIGSQQTSINELSDKMGIYLDPIGKMNVITSTWNLVIFYDLKAHLYQVKSLPNLLSKTTKYCQLLVHFEHGCRVITDSLEKRMESIKSNEILLQQSRREKRAPLEWIGSLYHAIFGLMDADNQAEIEEKFRRLIENQQRTKEEILKHTSLINSTMNILKKSMSDVQSQVNRMVNQINIYEVELTKNINQNTMALHFQMLTIQLTMLIDECEKTQNLIIEMLIDVHHGRINPTLISPIQLNKEIMAIRDKLPGNLELPGRKDHTALRDINHLMSAEGIIIEERLVINAQVPLFQSYSAEVFDMIAVPMNHKGRVLKVKLKAKYLIYNFEQHSYFLMSESQLSQCQNGRHNNFICHKNVAWLPALDQTCELSALTMLNSTNCEYEQTTTQPFWVKLHQENKWLFKIFKAGTLQFECGSVKNQVQALPQQGILSLNEGCTARYEGISLSGLQKYKTKVTVATKPIIAVIEDIPDEKLHSLKINPINLETNIKELEKSIKELNNDNFSLNSLSSIRLHQYTGHLSLLIIIFIIIIGCILYLRKRCKSQRLITINLSSRRQNVQK